MFRDKRLLAGWPFAALLVWYLFLPASSAAIGNASAASIPLHRTRSSPSDLEIGGDLAGVVRGKSRFVRYADLLRLPQETVLAVGDTNFAHPVQVSGVLLERLPTYLGAASRAQMVTASCDDGYKANYTAAYLSSHHPLLVLRIQGQPPAGWPKSVDGSSMEPYMISHSSFAPSFHVLSYVDEPQIPWGVIRIDFRDESEVYAGIQPQGPLASTEIVQQGFTIARQKCFRCHNRGAEGGTKAGRSWELVARRSVHDPKYFDDYVRHPKSMNPASQMLASPEYDGQTLAALRAYFQPFAEALPR